MSNNRSQYQSEFVIDFFKEEDKNASAFMPVAKSGLLRFVLLFGSAIIALTLVIVPILTEKANKQTAQSLFPAGVDTMATGSIQKKSGEKSYIERRSLLQPSPSSVCTINGNGTQQGDC